MDTQIAKGKVPPLRINLQAIGKGWEQGAGTPLLVIHRRNGGAHPTREGLVDGVEGSAKAPFIMGCWEQERALTGDATAMRCADTFHPAAICTADLGRHG